MVLQQNLRVVIIYRTQTLIGKYFLQALTPNNFIIQINNFIDIELNFKLSVESSKVII